MQQRTKRWVQRVQNNSTLEVVDVHSRCSKQALLGFTHFHIREIWLEKLSPRIEKSHVQVQDPKKISFRGVKSINVVDTNIFGMSRKMVNTRMHWKWYALIRKNKNGYCRWANISCIHMLHWTDSGALVSHCQGTIPNLRLCEETSPREFFTDAFGENMFKTQHLQTRLVSRNTI